MPAKSPGDQNFVKASIGEAGRSENFRIWEFPLVPWEFPWDFP